MKPTLSQRLGNLIPSISTNFNYERLPLYDSLNNTPASGSPYSATPLKGFKWQRPLSPISLDRGRWSNWRDWRLPRMSLSRLLLYGFILFGCIFLLLAGAWRRMSVAKEREQPPPPPPAHWEAYTRLNGYYNGIRTLVAPSDWTSEQEASKTLDVDAEATSTTIPAQAHMTPPFDPVLFNPYPEYDGYDYLKEYVPVEPCYLNEDSKVTPPNVFAYPGIPANMTAAPVGSYDLLGLDKDVCFDRFSRFYSYGYGYDPDKGGLGLADFSEKGGAEKVIRMSNKTDYRDMDWAKAQETCYNKNRYRFESNNTYHSSKTRLPRTAYVLRTYTGYQYTDYQILSLRAMINELSIKSGAEYDVHFLVQVKDNTIPIWADDDVYRKLLQDSLPEEFWGMATLWSEQQMRAYYPEPFFDNIENFSGHDIYSVYRTGQWALQWFSQEHPEYDYVWNWEMDVRFTGHYYEFHNSIAKWAKQQPRKGLWERSSTYYIPERHGSWENFTEWVESRRIANQSESTWGPVSFNISARLETPAEYSPPHSLEDDDYKWGVGEEADLITFNPIFDPDYTAWVFGKDLTGYDRAYPIPPRRAAIITVSRLSKRLLAMMHKETYKMKRVGFPEMYPATVAYHHGLKATYAPHPLYFDRDWPLETIDQVFNDPVDPFESVFARGEHNMAGTSFYYNSGFAGALWRRWLGARENNEGGARDELEGTGRMCLRSLLVHPIKFEAGSE